MHKYIMRFMFIIEWKKYWIINKDASAVDK